MTIIIDEPQTITTGLLTHDMDVTGDTPRYNLRSACDALKPQPPIDWIVENLFSAGSVNLIVGEAGSKKTWSMIDLCVAVAKGETWLKFSTLPGAVLIVDEESGERRLSRRLGDALRGHDASDETPLSYVSLAAFDFGNPDDVNQLHSLITQTAARFVVIDALADIMPGRDENAVQFVQPVFIALRKVAEVTQAAIVLIHHSNKAGGYRGSTAIKGAVDLLLQVESQPESPNIDFKTEKARDTEPFNFSAVAHFEPDRFYLTESTGGPSIKLAGAQEFVIRYLANNDDATIDDITGHADTCSPEAARRAVYSLAGDKVGYVMRSDTGAAGGRGLKATYRLTDRGREYAEKFL
ncbi:MAG TPA: AAA family ATPase [Anaerolineales bacterium]|jgi:hypothetical protein